MKKKILITGGLGFIGSHTVVELENAGYETIIVDNLSNSEAFMLDRLADIIGHKPRFYKTDLCDLEASRQIFEKENGFDAIIHFAAFKAVGEAAQFPLKYYRNNLESLLNVLQLMEEYKTNGIVFSSSATVYAQPDELPVTEKTQLKPALNAYGSTKQMGEDILEKCAAVGVRSVCLRYFNPVGAHESALIGELPIGIPNNLMPYITQTAIGQREQLTVYGDDYDTTDGTCIRDYIHVVDLAKAHVAACDRILEDKMEHNFEVYNVGTGNGNSVLEVINAFEQHNGVKLNYKIGPRRDGDAVAIYSDATLADEKLNWKAALGLKEMVTSAWAWQKAVSKKNN